MADSKPSKKPRLRKTAPTIRQRLETAQIKPTVKKSRVKKAAAKVKLPFKKIKLPRNRATSSVFKITKIVGRSLKWLVPRYFINSWREVRQVTWPTRKETWRLTGAVFVFAIVFGTLVAIVDKGLDAVFRNVVLK